MSKYIVRNGESLSDVCLNATGSLNNWSAILSANGFLTWTPTLLAGQSIIIPDSGIMQPGVKNILGLYPSNNRSIAADLSSQINDLINSISPIKDFDGNIYHSIKIGTQTWIIENFMTTHYKDGTAIPLITDGTAWAADTIGAMCYYDNDIANKAIYGALYNWFAVNNTHGLAINGWHVASKSDYETLFTFIGGTYLSGGEWLLAGGKLKETGTSHWATPNTGATDEVGFKALPGGFCEWWGNSFAEKNLYAEMWTSTEKDSTTAWWLELCYNNTNAYLVNPNKNSGYSVRLIKDAA